MNNITSKFATLISLSVILILTISFSIRAQEDPPERSIEGTWRTVVTQVNCSTGTAVAPAFPGILSFISGGTLIGTSATVNSGYGIWNREKGWQKYDFAFTSLRYNPTGVVIGSQVVRQTATLGDSGDDFTSSGTVQILDPAGNPVGSGCATSVGTRFQ